jgi:hypothetical protein
MLAAGLGARALAPVLSAAALLAGAAAAPAPSAAAQPARSGIWISGAELKRLPERGPAWDQLETLAHEKLGHADLSNQDSDHDVRVLATALVAARTGDRDLRKRAAAGVMDAIGTEKGGRTLSLARGLIAYVVAADLIDLHHFDRGKDRAFRQWLDKVRTEKLSPSQNPTLVATHELRPNNWGTHAGASRIAADVYLGDRRDLARAAAVFKGWLGDRSVYHGFVYGDKSWQADRSAPVGIDPAGSSKDGVSIGGALPDDMRRGCDFKDPPCPTRYPWEAMQGAVEQAQLLSRQGYDAWDWSDRALERAGAYLFAIAKRTGDEDFNAPQGHAWVPWLLNARYGTRFPAHTPAAPGKGMGFADWTAPVQRGTAPRGKRRTVSRISTATYPSSGRGTPPAAVGAGIAVLVAAAAGAGALLARRSKRRRRTVRPPQASAGPRA